MNSNRYQSKSDNKWPKQSTIDRHNGMNRYQIDKEGMEWISVYIKSNERNIGRYQTESE